MRSEGGGRAGALSGRRGQVRSEKLEVRTAEADGRQDAQAKSHKPKAKTQSDPRRKAVGEGQTKAEVRYQKSECRSHRRGVQDSRNQGIEWRAIPSDLRALVSWWWNRHQGSGVGGQGSGRNPKSPLRVFVPLWLTPVPAWRLWC